MKPEAKWIETHALICRLEMAASARRNLIEVLPELAGESAVYVSAPGPRLVFVPKGLSLTLAILTAKAPHLSTTAAVRERSERLAV
jgi:hypothetical protein